MSTSEDKENLKLDAYNALSVICALIFGFAVTILHSDLQNYDEVGLKNTASHVAIILGFIASGASMVASLEFAMELYHSKKLLHKYPIQATKDFSSNDKNKLNKKISRICMILSLASLLGQIIARCFASDLLPKGVTYASSTILLGFLLATLILQTLDILLVNSIIKKYKEMEVS